MHAAGDGGQHLRLGDSEAHVAVAHEVEVGAGVALVHSELFVWSPSTACPRLQSISMVFVDMILIGKEIFMSSGGTCPIRIFEISISKSVSQAEIRFSLRSDF